jgi:AcrR family transcriptional regulator
LKAQRSGKLTAKSTREDRRIRRTRDLLEQSLLSLIKEKPFDSISVQDIADRANIGRATFYLHYQNKEDLLGSGFAGLQTELREYQRAARHRPGDPDERLFAFSHYLLEHAQKNREVFPAMVGKRGGGVIQHVLRRLLTDLMREEVSAMSSEFKLSTLPTQATVEFLSSGLFALLVWWLNGKARISVEEMNDIFRRLAIPVLKAATPQRNRHRQSPGRSRPGLDCHPELH